MKKKGFTLVELLAVIAILAILVIIALPNVMGMFNQAKKNSFTTELQDIYNAAVQQRIADSLGSTRQNVYARLDGDIDDNKINTSDEYQPKELDLSGRKSLRYVIIFNKAGAVTEYYASDGSYIFGYKGTGLAIEDIADGGEKTSAALNNWPTVNSDNKPIFQDNKVYTISDFEKLDAKITLSGSIDTASATGEITFDED